MNDSCWRASMNPVEDVFAIEPPSSNAESLRDQQAAQVCAPDGDRRRVTIRAHNNMRSEYVHQPVANGRERLGRSTP
jgi:hypothetical protein